jgi:predicted lipid-binding transport protein (Tim44 family)
MRYSGDDYCYASAMVDHGLIGNQVESYFHVANYNGNRYSLTLFSNLGDLLGPLSGAIMPGLAIVLWVAGTFLLLRGLGKLIILKTVGLIVFQMASFLVFICLYQAPYLIQDLFWRSAMLAYLAPIISLTWLMVTIINYINKDRRKITGLVGIGVLAFASAGFSETGAALQVTILICCLAGVLLYRKMDLNHRRLALHSISLGLFITLVAILIMGISPSNANRIGDYIHPGPVRLITLSLSFALTFMVESVKSFPLPTLVTLAFSAVLALKVSGRVSSGKITTIKWLVASCLIVLVCTGLVVATAAPSVLARSAYPEQRAWMPGRFAITAGLVALGLLFGAFFHQIVKGAAIKQIIILVVMLATAAYTLRIVPRIIQDAEPLRSWAAAWDARDRYIRAEVKAGDQNIIVNSLPTIIPYVSELQEDPGYWYNLCAAGWYGIGSISATNNP